MSQGPPAHRNLWALTVLCLLRERPMHPYELQRLLQARHKDEFLVLKRGSLYHAIERLQQADLIAPVETRREGKRPERTVYRLTERGEAELLAWLRELIARPVREPSEFMAALSYLVHLPPDEALVQLESRATLLEAEIAAMAATLQSLTPALSRLNLLEIEYLRAMRLAERDWVGALIADLRTGRLTWDIAAILQYLRGV